MQPIEGHLLADQTGLTTTQWSCALARSSVWLYVSTARQLNEQPAFTLFMNTLIDSFASTWLSRWRCLAVSARTTWLGAGLANTPCTHSFPSSSFTLPSSLSPPPLFQERTTSNTKALHVDTVSALPSFAIRLVGQKGVKLLTTLFLC